MPRPSTVRVASVTSRDKFRDVVAFQGVTAYNAKLDGLMGYVTRWVNELQQLTEAEKARQLAESKASDLQNVAWAMALLVLIALLLGIWMGSSSRKDSNAPKPPVE